MPYVCESCDETIDGSGHYVELEYPVEGSEEIGRVSGRVCDRCAERTARSPPMARLIATSGASDPSAGREAHARAADALCMVTLAIEGVDLNALGDDDVRALLDVKATLSDMTLRNRRTGNALDG